MGICPEGRFAAFPNTSCEDCAAGKFSFENAPSCTTCPTGKWSPSGSRYCTTCPSGTWIVNPATQCSSCPLGKWSIPGSTSCASLVRPFEPVHIHDYYFQRFYQPPVTGRWDTFERMLKHYDLANMTIPRDAEDYLQQFLPEGGQTDPSR